MISPSKLRENIYNLLDEAIATGKPIEINRNGKILKIVPPPVKNDLSKLKKHNILINCEPDDIVHMDWFNEWNPSI